MSKIEKAFFFFFYVFWGFKFAILCKILSATLIIRMFPIDLFLFSHVLEKVLIVRLGHAKVVRWNT